MTSYLKFTLVVASLAAPIIAQGQANDGSVVTYHNQISRITQKHCQSCHHSGGVAPFELETYASTKSRAKTIQTAIEKRIMPPWFAADDKNQGPWGNDRSIPAADRAKLLNWIAAGSPEGDPKDAPPPLKTTTGWQIGKPDVVLQLPKPYVIKADGVLPYQYATIPVDYKEDRWVQAWEIKPTGGSAVHHALVYISPKGGINRKIEGPHVPSSGYFALYVPGDSSLVYPEGFAKRIPAGADLLFQLHYTPNGKEAVDQCTIGLVFAKKPPEHEVRTAGILNQDIKIPPGAENYKDSALVTVPSDMTIFSFLPHMHVRGKAARYELISTDGAKETLLDVPRYNFNWQLHYDYLVPKEIKKGSKLKFTCWFDNSSKNPFNPDPTQTVRYGPQTFEEMLLGYLDYYVPGATPGSQDAGLRFEKLATGPSKRRLGLLIAGVTLVCIIGFLGLSRRFQMQKASRLVQ